VVFELFRQAGAGYAVLTTKHHDGFLLWPSRTPNPVKEGYVASRDLVGELAEAVRAQGMRMGLYYSGGLDWTFDGRPIEDIVDLMTTAPQGWIMSNMPTVTGGS
jgi:alpha-L-fucosidase